MLQTSLESDPEEGQVEDWAARQSWQTGPFVADLQRLVVVSSYV